MQFYDELKRRNVIRVGIAYTAVAWLLVQVAGTILPLFGFEQSVARIIVIVLAIGFIPAMILAWVFEITPDGIKKEAEIDHDEPLARKTDKNLDRIIMVVLVLALSYFAFDKFVLSQERTAELEQKMVEVVAIARAEGRSEAVLQSHGETSIAVLPFADMSFERNQEYMSDGITEELLNLLSKIPELRVISRTSAFSFKGKDIKLTEIAKQLNVVHILEGSVRKSGDRLRITVQLIDARADAQLWSETYDLTLKDIFAIQDEVALKVVEQMKVTILGTTPKVQETDPEAYALYLQANHLVATLGSESLEKAVALYKQALSIDPKYAYAYTGLGTAYVRMAALRLISSEESNALIFDVANRALEIAPNTAQAHSLLAERLTAQGAKFKDITYHHQRALALDPTSTKVIGNIGLFLLKIGRVKEAVAFDEYRVSHDPANWVAYNNLGMVYRYDGRLEEAEESFSTALALSPTSGGINYERGVIRLQDKDYLGAVEVFKNEPITVFKDVGLVMAHHALGEESKSNEILKTLIDKYGDRIAYYVAQILSFKGDIDGAFEWLEKARLAQDGELSYALVEPQFANLHADDRWMLFLDNIGQSPEQLATIEFEVKLPQ